MATQWYCPPDVGALCMIMSDILFYHGRNVVTHMDTISASDAAVANEPKKQKMNPYTRVTAPPLTIAVELELEPG